MVIPQNGELLAGKYRVERVLGQGGMGVVVQAMHEQLHERVAVKFLLPDYAAHPEAAARFLREARAAVKIKSEHVARVIDVGALESGAPYMVMEFLQGQDLAHALEQEGPFAVSRAVDCVLQASEAIAEAHAAGIVHRDLKPANLFLTQRADRSAVVKVLDFGISKVTGPSDSAPDMSLTKTSTMMGSPLYMSPEQMRSARSADARSDQWALAVILYELVVGTPPFEAETLPELCAKILSDSPRPPSTVRPTIPAALNVVIARALEKAPAMRYPTISEFALALAPFGSPLSRTSVERISRVMEQAGLSTSRPGSDTEVAEHASTLSPWGQTTSRPRSSRGRLTVAAISVAVVGAAVAVYVPLRSKLGAEPSASASAAAAVAPVAASVAPPAAPPGVVSAVPAAVAPAAPAVPAPSTDLAVASAASAGAAPVAAPSAAAAPEPARPAVHVAPAVHARPRPAAPAAPAVAPAAPVVAPAAAPKPPTTHELFGDRK